MTRAESAAERRQRLVDTHAYNGLALLTLYDGWRYFDPPGLEGFVAFELHRGTAVACGDPVCAQSDLPELLSLFARYCADHRWRFALVGASARVGEIAARMGLNAVKIGEEPFFDLSRHSLTGRAAKKARSAINLARRTGVTVEEYRTPSPAIDTEIGEISREWLDARNAPPMGFLLRSRPLAERERKRIFIATYQGRTVAALTCAAASARSLLYVEEQLRRPDAPYGTSELLIEEARRFAKAQGIALFSLGTAPLQGAVRQPHGSFRGLRWLFRALCTKFNFIYSFRSLNHFKRKFAPSFWEDNFLVYQGALSLTAISVISAFASDGIPSLILPKKLQWLRFVPAATLWAGASAGVVLAALTAWQFPELVVPFRLGLRAVILAFVPADLMFDRAQVAVLTHRIISAVVVLALGAAVWQRRARA